MTTVFSSAELSKPAAVLILLAYCTLTPRASISCSMPATGLLALAKLTVLAGLWLCIDV